MSVVCNKIFDADAVYVITATVVGTLFLLEFKAN